MATSYGFGSSTNIHSYVFINRLQIDDFVLQNAPNLTTPRHFFQELPGDLFQG